MKKKKLSKVWSKRHFPEELWPEILSRLPVHALVRFRCVSRSWLSLINNPDFCRLHLKNFKNNRDENHLLVVEGKKQQCGVRCSDSFEYISEVLVSLGRRQLGNWQVECSVDGLVLLKKIRVTRFNDLMVWNPSIRKSHFIPPLSETEASPSLSGFDAELGLGYDPVLKDYKHVRLIFANDYILHSVAIYTLGAGSWKTIQFQGKGCSKWRWVLESLDMLAVYLRGSLYFFVLSPDKSVLELVSFDLSSEMFSCTSLPSDAYISSRTFIGFLTLFSNGSSLTVFDFDGKSAMWVLESSGGESEPMSWTQPYKFDLTVPNFLHLKKNGDLLIWWARKKTSFKLAADTKFVQRCGMVSSYNLETEEEKILLLQKGRRDFEIYNVFAHIESLNLLT